MSLLDFLRRPKVDESEDDEPLSTPMPAADTGKIEPYSATWLYVTNHAQAELQRLRVKNDSMSLDLAQTAELRGQIKAMKKLLALGKPKADNKGPLSDPEGY